MSGPIASVVIPAWNARKTLRAAAAAVIDQDLDAELELIVVDDGSSDGGVDELDRLPSRPERALRIIRLPRRSGPAVARNAALDVARAPVLAFTDSDCRPAGGWLRALLAGFADPRVGVVQGRTEGASTRVPLFEHHVETRSLDGSFATANIAYRREALNGLRFDPACHRWEDTDLGWRVVERGWQAAFAPDALVEHAIVRQRPAEWLLWPRHYAKLAAVTARHPGYRTHLFGGIWVSPMTLTLELALAGAAVAVRYPPALALVAPYAALFARRRGLRGRFPPAKAAAHVARDLVALASLAYGSARHQSLVL